MGRWSTLGGAVGVSILLVLSSAPGCGGKSGSQFNGGSNSSTSGEFGGDDASVGPLGTGGSSGGGNPYGMTTGAACPSGAKCNVACTTGTTTTISGTVYDPAGKDPLYGISVYIPGGPLQALPKGVPMGADACSCAALYKSGAIVSTTTDVNGKFTLENAPVGSNIPLVIQVGKWRHVTSVTTTSCQNTAAVDTNLNATVAAGSQDNMPDIAVSTGNADTLECLMKRIGLPDTEYVAGTATTGHIHVYSGGTPGGNGGNNVGNPEATPMPGAPESDTSLWDTSAHLMPYDILLLSCEGGETYKANPQNLETYLNAGGRAFASHFHYAWFSNMLASNQGYAAPADWGAHLATWASGGGQNNGPDDGVIVQTLNVGGGAFVKGQMLDKWLGIVGALGGAPGVPATDLSIYAPRYNAVVGPANTPSQPWITDEVTTTTHRMSTTVNQTMYFSFDTPVGLAASPDGGEPAYCGRAVFSDLHVAGNPNAASGMDSPNNTMGGGMGMPGIPDGQPPPTGCAAGALSPQEKALEFMLFDLSSCVISDSMPPPTMVPVVVN